MFVKQLSVEKYQDHLELFQDLTWHYRTDGFTTVLNVQEQLLSLDFSSHEAVLRAVDGDIQAESWSKLLANKIVNIRIETVWVKGICECLCVLLDTTYQEVYVVTQVLGFQIRRFSSLGLLNYLKWTIQEQDYRVVHYKKAIIHRFFIPREEYSIIKPILPALKLDGCWDNYGNLVLESPKVKTAKDEFQMALVLKLHKRTGSYCSYGFHQLIEDLLRDYSVEEVESLKQFMSNRLRDTYRDYFELTGEDWHVVYQTRVKVKADNESEARQTIESRGYVCRETILFNQQGRLNSRWFLVEGEKTLRLDHKFNDQSLSYYRHIVKKHLYDYLESCISVTGFKIYDRFGDLIWMQELTKPYIPPIPSFMLKSIESKIRYRKLKTEVSADLQSSLQLFQSQGSDYRGSVIINAFVEIKKTQSDKNYQQFLNKVKQILKELDDSQMGELAWICRKLFLGESSKQGVSALLTLGAKRELFLKSKLYHLPAILEKLSSLTELLKEDAQQMKTLRKLLTLSARSHPLTLEGIDHCVKALDLSNEKRVFVEIDAYLMSYRQQYECQFIETKISESFHGNNFVSNELVKLRTLFIQLATRLDLKVLRFLHANVFEELLSEVLESNSDQLLKERIIKLNFCTGFYTQLLSLQNETFLTKVDVSNLCLLYSLGDLALLPKALSCLDEALKIECEKKSEVKMTVRGLIRRGELTLENLELLIDSLHLNKPTYAKYLIDLHILRLTKKIPESKRVDLSDYFTIYKNSLIVLYQEAGSKAVKMVYQNAFYPIIQRLVDLISRSDQEKTIAELKSKIHDYAYVYLEFARHTIFKKEVVETLVLNHSFSELKRINDSVRSVEHGYTLEEKNILSRLISDEVLRTKTLTETTIEQVLMNVNDAIMGELDLTPQEKQLTAPFMFDINRYDKHLRLSAVVRALGLDYFKQCLNQEAEGLFQACEYDYPRSLIGEMIKHYLTVKDGSVLNQKSLYNQLRQIRPVSELVLGKFNQEEEKQVLHCLKSYVQNLSNLEIALSLRAKVEQKGSPAFLMAGNASVCCMSFGRSKAISYATEKGFGILNIYYKERIIGNSVLWLTSLEDYQTLVLDNIEIHPNYTKYNTYIEILYREVIKQLKVQYQAHFVVQGSKYNDLKLYQNGGLGGSFKEIQAIDVENSFYTDARHFYFVLDEEDPSHLSALLNGKVFSLNEETEEADDWNEDDALPF